ncbi:hypothetical protein DJ564_16480 [Pseudomonas sp. 31-12]|nr:hypothetical protein DJ564_16480 [Pseudomonas sp. 31-12]
MKTAALLKRAALSINFFGIKTLSNDHAHSLGLVHVSGGGAGDSTFLILDHELQATYHPTRLVMPRQGMRWISRRKE